MPIPNFDKNGNLPEGIHSATWQEVQEALAFNEHRQELLRGLKRSSESVKLARSRRLFLGGSFVTNKEFPGDFDACWEDENVDFVRLQEIDPVLLDFNDGRSAQKAKYGGELFPASSIADNISNESFLEFFQQKNGEPKGIIAINL